MVSGLTVLGISTCILVLVVSETTWTPSLVVLIAGSLLVVAPFTGGIFTVWVAAASTPEGAATRPGGAGRTFLVASSSNVYLSAIVVGAFLACVSTATAVVGGADGSPAGMTAGGTV